MLRGEPWACGTAATGGAGAGAGETAFAGMGWSPGGVTGTYSFLSMVSFICICSVKVFRGKKEERTVFVSEIDEDMCFYGDGKRIRKDGLGDKEGKKGKRERKEKKKKKRNKEENKRSRKGFAG